MNGTPELKHQRGVASLLMLLLVGIAISTAIFGAVRFIQGSQSQSSAFHSQTQSQINAWRGVDQQVQAVAAYYADESNISAAHKSDLQAALESDLGLLASQNPQVIGSSVSEHPSLEDTYLVRV